MTGRENMDDTEGNDEEFIYTGDADQTGSELNGEDSSFGMSDEEMQYRTYADEAFRTMSPEGRKHAEQSYGDSLVEVFSADSNISRLSRFTKIPAHISTYIFSLAYLVVGILCISIPKVIIEVLPYIVGIMMIVIGGVQFVMALIKHEYRHVKTNDTATSLILVALGIMIMIQMLDEDNDSAIMLISVVWGILGLFEAAHLFNHAFKRLANSERFVYYLIKGIIECVVAFTLLYQPANHDAHEFHIIMFGINMLIDAVTMIPQVKAVVTSK